MFRVFELFGDDVAFRRGDRMTGARLRDFVDAFGNPSVFFHQVMQIAGVEHE